jgi:hypothetical protein
MDQTNNPVKYCPYCGNQNNKENKFCISCGGALVAPTQQSNIAQGTPVNMQQIVSPQEPNIENQESKTKIGFHTLVGVLALIPWIIGAPLFFIIAVILVLFYIFMPGARNGLLSLLNGIGHLAVGGFIILLILGGACFIMIGLG